MDEALLKKINELIDDAHFEDALDLLNNEKDPNADLQKIICYVGLKEYNKAIELANEALKDEQNQYYYDILSLYVVSLIETHQDEAAIDVLKKELEMPFIPHEFEPFFKDTYDKLLKKQKGEKVERSPYDLLSDDELNEMLITTRNTEELALAIYQTHSRNIRNFLASLEVILMDTSIPAYLKTIVLELLHEQNVSEEFEYHSKDYVTRIYPDKLTPLFETPSFKVISTILKEKVGSDDVSLADISYQIMASILAGVYPREISELEYDAIAASIYKLANEMLGYKLEDQDIIDLFNIEKPELDVYYVKIKQLNNLEA